MAARKTLLVDSTMAVRKTLLVDSTMAARKTLLVDSTMAARKTLLVDSTMAARKTFLVDFWLTIYLRWLYGHPSVGLTPSRQSEIVCNHQIHYHISLYIDSYWYTDGLRQLWCIRSLWSLTDLGISVLSASHLLIVDICIYWYNYKGYEIHTNRVAAPEEV